MQFTEYRIEERDTMRKRIRQFTGILMACAMLQTSFTVPAAETEAAGTQAAPEGQLTLEEIDAMNGGAGHVYLHDDRVTLVDGTCTQDLVTGMDDAEAVVNSMITLIGGDADTQFVPWRQVMDPLGNVYYIFQQMYHDTTVCGGAVKVVTDADCNMIGLSSSVESDMPDVEKKEGITAQEAQQIVLDKELEATGISPEVLDQYTGKVVLPSVLEYSMENEDSSSRFVWVVYTNNPYGREVSGSDLPYLAHYVSMSGEYLYNLPAIAPADEAGRTGYDAGYIFEFMEPAEYTGYVDVSDGTEKEISVTVMRDKRTGMYYLGNIERRIVVAECYDFLYGGGQVVLESSRDNLEWDQVGLLSLYNYCRAWDYYNEIGWTGGDGEGTPCIILNNFCDDHYNEVNNACYAGKINGMQVFLASKINDFSQCLDVIAHEFTHCVTGSLMTYNSYKNDYGAINEGMSDVQGKNCEMMAGDVEADDWILGSKSLTPARSMSDPHAYKQPEYSWDEYYVANAKKPSSSNDHGGVHFNSSLMNQISYLLVQEGGMSLDEARIFWFMTDCMMVPGTDYVQLAELLPWVLKTARMEQYAGTLDAAIEKTRLADKTMPETLEENHAMIRLSLPDTEAFDAGNWMMMLTTIKLEDMISKGKELLDQVLKEDYSFLPESVQVLVKDTKDGKPAQKSDESGDWKEALFTALLEGLEHLGAQPETEQSEPQEQTETNVRTEETVQILKDLKQWLLEECRSFAFLSYGFAGQDGSTLNMVVHPGRCVPMLQHVVANDGSQVPDQLAMAVYIHGKWYDVGLAQMQDIAGGADPENTEFTLPDLPMQVLTDIFGENMENIDMLFNVRSIDDLLDLFTVDVKGGEILELSSNGLDQVVIPEPTPPAEKTYGQIAPGKKSRPKLESETEALTEDRTEPETQDQAA